MYTPNRTEINQKSTQSQTRVYVWGAWACTPYPPSHTRDAPGNLRNLFLTVFPGRSRTGAVQGCTTQAQVHTTQAKGHTTQAQGHTTHEFWDPMGDSEAAQWMSKTPRDAPGASPSHARAAPGSLWNLFLMVFPADRAGIIFSAHVKRFWTIPARSGPLA